MIASTGSVQSATVRREALSAQSVFADPFVAAQVALFLLTVVMALILPISTVVGGLSTVQRLQAVAGVVPFIVSCLSQIRHDTATRPVQHDPQVRRTVHRDLLAI